MPTMAQPYCFANNTTIPPAKPQRAGTQQQVAKSTVDSPAVSDVTATVQSPNTNVDFKPVGPNGPAGPVGTSAYQAVNRTRLPPSIPEYMQKAISSVSDSRLDVGPVDLETDEDEDEEDDPSAQIQVGGTYQAADRQAEVPTVRIKPAKEQLSTAPDPMLMLHRLPVATDPLAKDVEKACLKLIQALNLPVQLDSVDLEATAGRMARVYLSMMKGLYRHDPFTETLVETKDHGLSSQVIGPIDIQTTCSQHLLPVYGSCTISIIRPRIIKGTTRYLKYLRWLTSRPWLQEELGTEIADRFCAITQAQKVEVALAIEQLSLDQNGTIARHKVLTRHQAKLSDLPMEGRHSEGRTRIRDSELDADHHDFEDDRQ